MNRKVAVLLSWVIGALLSASASAITWVGNTKLYENGNAYPNRSGYIESAQAMTIVTQTYPIAPNQQVYLEVTTDNWKSTREYVFSFDKNIGNNSQWYCVMPNYSKNSSVQFYIKASELNNGTVYDNNSSANYGYMVRPNPNWRGTPIIQWFATDYQTIMKRLPEIVQLGYGAIYLPAPQKSGGGGTSAGYNPFDPFDLGDHVQEGSMNTEFGSSQDLQQLIKVAHRLGIEVYCDLVLNHFDNRAYTPINTFPGVIPEDFHIYSSANSTNANINFNTTSDLTPGMWNGDVDGLADIAQEDGNAVKTGTFTLPSYATFNGSGKPSFIRNAMVPATYPDGAPKAEDVREYQKRWCRWLTTSIGFDGFRLDAAKHMPCPWLGYAPDQPTNGYGCTNGDLMNYLYSYNPNLYAYAEVYTSNAYELKEYTKCGLNMLDFPLFFNYNSIFNSHGLGDLGAALSNAYGVDSNGLPYEKGGLGSLMSVSFVQSHDNGPPEANNLAYAFNMTRPARPQVYYDGNNVQPGNFTLFPKPGRADAMGLSTDVLPPLLDVHNRFSRGYITNRWVASNLYIYEHQVNGVGILLVGLNSRGDLVSQTQAVQTAFAPGTILKDYSGQQPNVVVGSDSKVTITVPPNSSSSVTNNATGYVMYAPVSPSAVQGVRSIVLSTGSTTSSSRPSQLVPTVYTLPKGTYGTTKTYEAYSLTSDSLSIAAHTDATGIAGYAKFDAGATLGALVPATNTSEGLTDGFIAMDKTANGQFRLQNVDLSSLSDGLHTIRIRVFSNTGTPAVYSDFVTFFYLNHSYQGASLSTPITGSPLISQARTASSNNNRADGLYVSNDDTYLYVNVAGRVDPSNSYTNGLSVWMDTDPGSATGVTNFSTLADDSGPAPRLLSFKKFTAPSGFGAEMGIAMYHNTTFNAAPESPLPSGLATPFQTGSFAGAFRFSSLKTFTPVPVALSYTQRTNKTDTPNGMRAALRLSDVFPNGLSGSGAIGFIASIGSTGESGSPLTSTDPNFSALSGRAAYQPYTTNQFLPSQDAAVNDPGTASVALNRYAYYSLQQATVTDPASTTITSTPPTRTARDGTWSIGVTVTANTAVSGNVTLLVNPGNSAVLTNRTGVSLVSTGYQALQLTTSGMSAGQSISVQLKFSGTKVGFSPTFSIRNGTGLY